MIEVFPAPAQVRLFGLPKALPYKKKQKRAWSGCQQALQQYIDGLRALRHPQLTLPAGLVVAGEIGRRYKDLEDQVDAVICAYVAALAWLDTSRMEIFGTTREGYVVVPTPIPRTA